MNTLTILCRICNNGVCKAHTNASRIGSVCKECERTYDILNAVDDKPPLYLYQDEILEFASNMKAIRELLGIDLDDTLNQGWYLGKSRVMNLERGMLDKTPIVTLIHLCQLYGIKIELSADGVKIINNPFDKE